MNKTIKTNRIKDDKSIASAVFKMICITLLSFYALTIFFTFFWAIVSSLKTSDGYRLAALKIIPFSKQDAEYFTFKNYYDVFTKMTFRIVRGNSNTTVGMFGMLINSLVFSVGGAFFSALSCCVTAYAVVRFKNWMSGLIYTIVIVTMALPIVGSLPSELTVLRTLNLYDTRTGLVLLTATFLGMHFLIFHASFKAIPKDFAEAAKIDGAGEWRIFLTIMFPLVKLTFLTIFLLKFVQLWNNYETPNVHTPDLPVLALGVFRVKNKIYCPWATDLHAYAVSIIVFIPILVFFLFTHKRLIGNLSMGGVKG